LRVFFTNESTSNLPGDSLNYVWQFGDGEVATTPSPAHTFEKEGTYHVILQAFSTLTQQSASFSIPITVIDRSSAHIPVSGIARLRPQVLMAGFDPMLVDLLDTDMKVFAIIRPGGAPLQTVRAIQNEGDFVLVLQHVATYANGDQHYEAVYPFAKGALPVSTFADLFGDQAGQFRIQAIDQAGQFHSFPNLEIGDNPPLETVPLSLHIEPLQQVGVHRSLPQVLAAGFDPALVDMTDSQFTVKAIVREGLFPIQRVMLKQNKGEFNLSMRHIETLPNGDKLYAVTYTYPRESLNSGSLGNLLGGRANPEQFMVIAVDQAQQIHRFPEFKIGNFPKQ
jgi:PKD repeat protein